MTEKKNAPEVGTAAELAKLAKDIHVCMLTTVDHDKRLVSRPMGVQLVEFDGDVWFFAEKDSELAAQIVVDPNVGVSLSDGSTWISLSGQAAVVDDRAKIAELWNQWVEAWLPNGKDDPNTVLIKVDGAKAEYWDTPGGRISSIMSFVKAKVTGKPYEGGENAVVTL